MEVDGQPSRLQPIDKDGNDHLISDVYNLEAFVSKLGEIFL